MACREVIYKILANDNPEEYPLDADVKPISTYSAENGVCTFNSTVQWCSGPNDEPPCEDITRPEPYPDCDCSDPEKYNFEDQGRFKLNFKI